MLVSIFSRVHIQVSGSRLSIRIRSKNKDLIFQIWDECSTLRNGGNQQWRLTYRDRFATGLAVSGGIFDGGLNQHTGCTLGERVSGKISRQCEIKVIRTFAISLALNGSNFENRDIHAGRFDFDFGFVHWLAKEIVGMNSSSYVIARTITALGFVVLAGKINRDFKLRQYISLDVQRNLRRVGGSCIGFTHERAKMVGPEINFVGQAKLR